MGISGPCSGGYDEEAVTLMEKTDVLVLGGGLAGMSFAYHWQRLTGKSCPVLEKKGRPGGLAGTVDSFGFLFDHTGHLLHLHDPYGKRFIMDLLKGNLALHKRNSWIFSYGVFTRYPFQANTHGLPSEVVDDCVVGALGVDWSRTSDQGFPRRGQGPPSFHQFALNTFGKGICKHFMFPFNRKLWKMDLKRLTTEWQGRFIPRPKPEDVLYGALADQKKSFGYNAYFRYPIRGGAQALPDALAARLPDLRLGVEVVKVDLGSRVAMLGKGQEIRYERLVNTMPLKHFLGICEGLTAEIREAGRRLRYNTVYNLNIGIARPNISEKHWVYFPEREYPFYRVGFGSNFSPHLAPRGTSSMYIEVSGRPGRPFDYDRAESACLDGLRRCGILKPSDRLVTRKWITIDCAYVVYDFHRTPAVNRIFAYLARRGVESIGRYGGWKYSFMEEAIMDGKRCAEGIAGLKAAVKRGAKQRFQNERPVRVEKLRVLK